MSVWQGPGYVLTGPHALQCAPDVHVGHICAQPPGASACAPCTHMCECPEALLQRADCQGKARSYPPPTPLKYHSSTVGDCQRGHGRGSLASVGPGVVRQTMRHWSCVGFVCFSFLLVLGSRSVDAKKKLQIDRAEGPVDQSVYERGLVTEDVKARDILQARHRCI